MSSVVRLTTIPKSIGPLYRLCKTCGGSGERRRPEVAPKLTAKGAATAKASARRARDCPKCNGLGEVLS